jgi:ribose-phosphate pyrophosphokinase
MLAEAIRPSLQGKAVIVSPDLGAVKMAERYAKFLDSPVAIIHKTRIGGAEVKVQRIVGDVCDKEVLIIDDMITTGGTIEKAIEALLEAGCSIEGIKVVAPHALLIGPAAERLGELPIERMYVTDSVTAPKQFPVPIQVVSLGGLLAETVHRLHTDQSLAELIGDR